MEESVYQERRNSPRFDLKRRVEIHIPGLKQRIEAQSLDVSSSGMRLRLNSPVDLNFPVRISIAGEPDRHGIECDGRIAWVERGAIKQGVVNIPYDAGIRFTRTPDDLSRLIDELRISRRPIKKTLPALKKPIGLEPVFIREKFYEPHVQHESVSSIKWRLSVLADGKSRLIGTFVSAQEATDEWRRFAYKLKDSTAHKIKRLLTQPMWAFKYAIFGYLIAWSFNTFFVPSEWTQAPDPKRPELVLWVKGIHW